MTHDIDTKSRKSVVSFVTSDTEDNRDAASEVNSNIKKGKRRRKLSKVDEELKT